MTEMEEEACAAGRVGGGSMTDRERLENACMALLRIQQNLNAATGQMYDAFSPVRCGDASILQKEVFDIIRGQRELIIENLYMVNLDSPDALGQARKRMVALLAGANKGAM